MSQNLINAVSYLEKRILNVRKAIELSPSKLAKEEALLFIDNSIDETMKALQVLYESLDEETQAIVRKADKT